MTMMDSGTTGAKRQSWANANPRDVLKRLAEKNPNWAKERLLEVFRTEIVKKQEYIDVIIEYWFANNFYSLFERPTTTSTVERQRQHSETIKTQIAARIEQEAKVLLLKMKMPNGKPLAECTGAECRSFGTKLGGFLFRIAKRIKPDDVVGAVLTEEQVREMYKKTNA